MEKELIEYPRPSPYCYVLQKRDGNKMSPDVAKSEKLEELQNLEVSRVLHDLTTELFPRGDQTPAYRNLTSLFKSCEEQIGRKFNYCLLKAVSSSNFSTPEQAIMEIGRSTLLFVILIHALASEDLMVTSLVLNTASNLNLFDKRRSVPYLKDLLKTEFNLMPELCAKAYSFGMRIKASGLLEIPDITLDILKCFSEEEDIAAGASVVKMEEGVNEGASS